MEELKKAIKKAEELRNKLTELNQTNPSVTLLYLIGLSTDIIVNLNHIRRFRR